MKEEKKITEDEIDPICARLSNCENDLDSILSTDLRFKLTKHEYNMLKGIYACLSSVERSYFNRPMLKKQEVL